MAPNTPSDVIQPARRAYSEGKDLVQDKLSEAQETARSLYRRGKEKAGELEEGFESFVQEQPVKSVLIAAGVGILVGFLISRR